MNGGQDVLIQLNSLKQQIDQGKNEKAKAEANKETYEKQKQEIIAQLAELQVAPENLDAEIAKLETEIQQALAKAEELLGATQPAQQPAQGRAVATFVSGQVGMGGS